MVTPEAIHIPFHGVGFAGHVYKLAGIRLAPGLLRTQAEFDKQSQHSSRRYCRRPAMCPRTGNYISSQYHNKGYMKAAVHPMPSFDRAQGTVSFAVTVEPGPVYTMGKLTIENGADDLRAAMLAAWKLPAGAVFNESAVLGFFSICREIPARRRTNFCLPSSAYTS